MKPEADQLLEKAEPQEVRVDEVEESKASALQVVHNSREASGSPAMEDKQPQSLVLQASPFLAADQSFGLEPPHM